MDDHKKDLDVEAKTRQDKRLGPVLKIGACLAFTIALFVGWLIHPVAGAIIGIPLIGIIGILFFDRITNNIDKHAIAQTLTNLYLAIIILLLIILFHQTIPIRSITDTVIDALRTMTPQGAPEHSTMTQTRTPRPVSPAMTLPLTPTPMSAPTWTPVLPTETPTAMATSTPTSAPTWTPTETQIPTTTATWTPVLSTHTRISSISVPAGPALSSTPISIISGITNNPIYFENPIPPDAILKQEGSQMIYRKDYKNGGDLLSVYDTYVTSIIYEFDNNAYLSAKVLFRGDLNFQKLLAQLRHKFGSIDKGIDPEPLQWESETIKYIWKSNSSDSYLELSYDRKTQEGEIIFK